MSRPVRHEDCPALDQATQRYHDHDKASRRPGMDRKAAYSEATRLGDNYEELRGRAVVKTVYARNGSRWEPVGKMCLACHQFWPSSPQGVAGSDGR